MTKPVKGTPMHASGLLSEETADGMIIVSPTNGHLRVLNPLGASVWSLMDGSHSVEDLEKVLRNRYVDVKPEQIRHDLFNFLLELMNRGLISGLSIDSRGSSGT